MPFKPGTKLGPYEIISAVDTAKADDLYTASDTRLKRKVEKAESAAIVTSSGTRYFLRQLVEASLPNLTVLSHNEIPPEIKVRSRGVIE